MIERDLQVKETTVNARADGLLIRAVAFAADKHRNQRRKDVEASPYINHPIALADLLANEGGITDIAVLCAALLHDTIEDTETTAAELESAFGREITGIVFEVTNDKSCQRTSASACLGSYFKGGCGILAA